MIKVLITLAPELLKLIWAAYKRHKAGHDSKFIKRSLQNARAIFEMQDRTEVANHLNNIFNNRPK